MHLRLIILLVFLALFTACNGQAGLAVTSAQTDIETPVIVKTEPATVEPEPTASKPAPTDAPATAKATTESFPVTIEHKYGRTKITKLPQRIVTVGLTDHDALALAGGVRSPPPCRSSLKPVKVRPLSINH